MSEKIRIMCFGDSLTWGWVPTTDGPPTTRYSLDDRWPGAMLDSLGKGYELIEEGLNARTTDINDPYDPRLNGSDYLPSAIASHMPLHMVIIMLGTNDTKKYFNRSAFDITNGVSRLVNQVISSTGGVGTRYPAPRPLLVAPPLLGEMRQLWQRAKFEGAREKTMNMAKYYEAYTDQYNVEFLNAGKVISTDGVDGVHLTARNNRDLGLAIADKVRQVLQKSGQ